MGQSLPKEVKVILLVNNFPVFYVSWRFINVVKTTCHLDVLNQMNPVHIHEPCFFKIYWNNTYFLTCVYIYQVVSVLKILPAKILYAFLISLSHATCIIIILILSPK
jgi:predicted transcriptional regulator